MPVDRLSQLEENLEDLREQIGGKEKAMNLAAQDDKVRIKQGIRELRKQMKSYEEEYWQILARGAAVVDVPDAEAEVIVAEIVEQYPQIKGSDENAEVLAMLQKIYEKINEPGVTAVEKLKGSLYLMPPFVGVTYEAELDTENTLRKYFPTFSRWTKQWLLDYHEQVWDQEIADDLELGRFDSLLDEIDREYEAGLVESL